jgi:hypothetical protein
MKKGLLTTLTVAITFACLSSAVAMAPTIRDNPDVTIGDMEDYLGSDNNYFVYTNAFEFDKYVSDGDSTISALMWTFDEHSMSGEPTDTPWFSINGQSAVHVGDSAMAADSPTPTTEHQNPSINELRGVSAYASFRDIVFSPGTGVPPPAFPDPTEPAKTNHDTGKVVRFYVSDGTNVASKEIIVNTIDNGWDALSGGSKFTVAQDDTFTTDSSNFTAGSTVGWVPLDVDNQIGKATTYDAANTAYRVAISSGSSIRINGWQTANSEWLPYTMVGTGNVARGKFYMFRTGQASMTDFNQIPNTRFRLAQRFAVTALLEVFCHSTDILAVQQLAWELRPSQDPNSPSIYRVDLDPIDVPQMSLVPQPPYPEGILRAFEAYALEAQENGSVELTESVIGYYPKVELESGFATKTKAYATSGSDAGDLKVFNSVTEGAFRRLFVLNGPGGALGTEILPLPGSGVPTYTENSAGLTLDSTAVATDRFGLCVREFAENLGVNSDRFRVAPDKQYMYRFHVTSTTNSNTNPELRMRAYSVKFQWAQKLVVGGSQGAGSLNNTVAREALPGNGCMNPDKDGAENGGYYNLIIHTPMSTDIQASQPFLAAQPGPGDPLPASGVSRRDLKFGIDLQDTISGSPAGYVLEAGNFRLDKVNVYEHNLVAD